MSRTLLEAAIHQALTTRIATLPEPVRSQLISALAVAHAFRLHSGDALQTDRLLTATYQRCVADRTLEPLAWAVRAYATALRDADIARVLLEVVDEPDHTTLAQALQTVEDPPAHCQAQILAAPPNATCSQPGRCPCMGHDGYGSCPPGTFGPSGTDP